MTTASVEFFVTGGSLRRDASSYVVRKSDRELYETLIRREFCYVLTSRQMGKSSLMIRTAVRLREAGVRVAILDLTAIGQNLTPEQWYDGLLMRLAQQLDLEDALEEYWQKTDRLGPLQRFMGALRDVVLPEGSQPGLSQLDTALESPLVIFIDEIDTVRSLSFSTDEFFAAIRECYNRRDPEPRFQRLTFCLLGVASPSDLIRDTRMTPFNIGRRIELNDFTLDEAEPLANGLAERRVSVPHKGDDEIETNALPVTPAALARSKALLARILYWTGGHPYLTQRLCLAVAESEIPTESLNDAQVDRICAELYLSASARERDDNLIFVRERLLRNEAERTSLLDLYAQVQSGKRVKNDETYSLVALLRLSGIVRAADGFLEIRNRIYERVFDRAWIRENMPDAEIRRQSRAFRQGAIRAVTFSALGLLLLVGVFLSTRFQKHLHIRHVLKDGSSVTLEDITYGKRHGYEPGSFRWQDMLGASNRAVRDTDTDCLFAWISQQDSRMQNIGMVSPVAVDEHGCVFFSVFAASAPESNGIETYGYQFRSFPHRSKTISLRILDRSSPAQTLTEFIVPNPAPTLYPLWTPEPYPITKLTGDLAVTLKEIRANGTTFVINGDTLVPVFHYQQNGRTTDEWETDEVLPLTDATGNVSRIVPGATDSSNLCPFEPAWKLEGVFFRKKTAQFAPSETWTVKQVPMPGPAQIHPISRATVQNGITIQLRAIAGPGHFSYTVNGAGKAIGSWQSSGAIQNGAAGFSVGSSQNNGVAATDVSCSLPHIAISVDQWETMKDRRLTVWATDQKKRRFNVEYSNQNSEQQYYALRIPPDVKIVDLHFAVQTARHAEFLIKPPVPLTTDREIVYG